MGKRKGEGEDRGGREGGSEEELGGEEGEGRERGGRESRSSLATS